MDDLSKAYFLDVKREEMKGDAKRAIEIAYSDEDFGIDKAFIILFSSVQKLMEEEDYKELNEHFEKCTKNAFLRKKELFEKQLQEIKGGLNGFSRD